MSRIVTWSLRIAICIAGLLVLVIVALTTAAGQRAALSLAGRMASTQDFTLTFGRLEGSLLNRARISRISVADRDGKWLQLRNISVTWSAVSLLGGHVNVEDLQIDAIDLIRKPVTNEQSQRSSSATAMPMMRITLRRMRIEDLILREAFAGTAARFEVNANADLVDHHKGLAVLLAAKRLDQPGAKLQARVNYGGTEGNLAVQVSASEPAGGLVANLLQIPRRPPLALKFSGEGPLDAWKANWSIRASGQPFVAGRVRLDRDGVRHRLATDFSGYVQAIVPRSLADLVAGQTTGALVGHFAGLDRLDFSHVQLASDAIRLRASGGFERATTYAYGTLSLDVGREDSRAVEVAIVGDKRLSIRRLQARLSLPDEPAARDVSLDLEAHGVTHPHATVAALKLSARAKQPEPVGANALSAERIEVQLTTDGFSSPVNGLAEAIGRRTHLQMRGTFAAGALTIDAFRLGDGMAHVTGEAVISAQRQSATARLSVGDIGRFSTLVGERLAGRLDLKATTAATWDGGAYKVTFGGAANDMDLGRGAIAGLIGKNLNVTGEVVRDTTGGIVLRNFDASSSNLSIATKGRYSWDETEFDSTIAIADLSAVQQNLSGSARLEVRLQGTADDLASRVRGTTRQVTWRGNAVEDLALRFDGKGSVKAHRGHAGLTGSIGQREFDGSALVTVGQAGLFIARDVAVKLGRNTLAGHVRLAPDATPTGKITLEASHLSDLDVIIGQEISGALFAAVEFTGHHKRPSLRLDVRAPQVAIAGNTLKQLRATAALDDVLGSISGQASVTLAELSNTASRARLLSLKLHERDRRMVFAGSGQVNGARLNVDGSFKQQDETVSVFVDRIDITRAGLKVKLADRARLVVGTGGVHIQRLRLSTGRGLIALGGSAGADALNLEARLTRVPAGIANVFAPALGLGGAISGRARVNGTPADPTAKIIATWNQASARISRENHLPPVTIKLNGDVRDGTAKATVDLHGPQALALSIDGDAQLGPGRQMRLQLTGDVPLALANPALAARATQLSGRARISGTALGTPAAPTVDVQIEIPDAALHDPSSGIRLRRVVGSMRITEHGLVIRRFTGQSALGGTLSIDGALSRVEQGAAQARITAQLAQFRFNDNELMAGEVDGNVTLTGPVDALAARGRVFVRRLDLTVPAAAPRSIAALNVKHVNAPERLARSVNGGHSSRKGTSASRIALDILIDTANRIFVKGRGLDAQLGGELRLRGMSDAPVTDGAFVMQRGRLDVVGRRLEFRRGRILFDGAPEPVLDMEAVTVADDVTIIVTLTGMASRPAFKFTSNPELPEDEVIARLLFNKGLVGLSPLQLVQLASEVNKLGGLSSGPGILDKIKRSVGVDVLDVSTDKTGAAAVSAGSYVTDKTFVGVRQGATAGSSRVIIDHDFTKNLKARGEVGVDGNSKLGIGLEWDY